MLYVIFPPKVFLFSIDVSEAASRGVLWKKGVLRIFAKFTGKHQCQVSFLINLLQFIKKETLTLVFSCEFCEISTNIFFHKTPLVAASDIHLLKSIIRTKCETCSHLTIETPTRRHWRRSTVFIKTIFAPYFYPSVANFEQVIVCLERSYQKYNLSKQDFSFHLIL